MSNALDEPILQEHEHENANSLAPAIAFDSSDSISLSDDSTSPLPKRGHSRGYNVTTTDWSLLTITLCITYIIISTQMPFYNKIALEIYDYPITSCFIQVFGLVFLLILISSLSFYHQTKISPFRYLKNLFCDRFFLTKCKYLIAPALFFSFNIIFTNIGIKLTSITVHILLRATEIIWFVLLTPILTQNKPTKQAIFAAFIVTIGATALAFVEIDADNITFAALLINILSAFFTPLQIIFLRRATDKLLRIFKGTMDITKQETLEITCIKMLLSLIFIFPAALIVEKEVAFKDLSNNFGSLCNWMTMLIGIVLTLLFQWNVVALTSKVEPVLIGTLQQSKGIWTYIVSLIIGGATLHICSCDASLKCGKDYPACPCFKNATNLFEDGQYAIAHIIGVIAIIFGMAYYSFLKYKNQTVH